MLEYGFANAVVDDFVTERIGGIGALSLSFLEVVISFGGEWLSSVDDIVSGSVRTVLLLDWSSFLSSELILSLLGVILLVFDVNGVVFTNSLSVVEFVGLLSPSSSIFVSCLLVVLIAASDVDDSSLNLRVLRLRLTVDGIVALDTGVEILSFAVLFSL